MVSIVEAIAEATNKELAYKVYEAIRPLRLTELTEIDDEIYNDKECEMI